MTQENTMDKQQWDALLQKVALLKQEVAKTIVGHDSTIELMLVALLCKGHCIIEGVPGLAKTLLVSTFAKALGLSFQRIQFTPDLMPMDITGCDILQETGESGQRCFEFIKGPLFANLILADEINRTPPKTQAALLEAMQEKQVTVGDKTFELEEPFIVFATQNPIEHEGTYPLPEAQLDRFFFNIVVGYPTLQDEREIVLRTTGNQSVETKAVLTQDDVLALQEVVRDMPMPDNVLDGILQLTSASRPGTGASDDYIGKYVEWGTGPRASQNMTLATKALAFIRGNPLPSMEEVVEVIAPVFRHRVILNYNATGEGVRIDDIITHLRNKV